MNNLVLFLIFLFSDEADFMTNFQVCQQFL